MTGYVSTPFQTLILPLRLPGLNELLEAAKGAAGKGSRYHRLKAQYTELIGLLAKAHKLRPAIGMVRLHFRWVEENRRRDPDNFTSAGRKLILDGLVKAKVLQGDGWAHVAGWSDRWEVAGLEAVARGGGPRIVVEIHEVGP